MSIEEFELILKCKLVAKCRQHGLSVLQVHDRTWWRLLNSKDYNKFRSLVTRPMSVDRISVKHLPTVEKMLSEYDFKLRIRLEKSNGCTYGILTFI